MLLCQLSFAPFDLHRPRARGMLVLQYTTRVGDGILLRTYSPAPGPDPDSAATLPGRQASGDGMTLWCGRVHGCGRGWRGADEASRGGGGGYGMELRGVRSERIGSWSWA